jgi:hypothetical protein
MMNNIELDILVKTFDRFFTYHDFTFKNNNLRISLTEVQLP